jgi:hypothetical protein
MDRQTRRALLIAGGFVALVTLIFIVDRAEDWLVHIEYPFNVWRMDLDDIAANIGLFLAGAAAFIVAIRKADKAHKKADQVSERVNGGMARMVKEHVAIATNEATETSHYIDLLSRVTEIEKQRDDCHQQLTDIKEWVVNRLDETGNGRSGER